MKTIRVVLAFHAHEPLWDLPRVLQASSRDRRVNAGVTPESYVRRRFNEGRNVYRDLVAFAAALEAPVALDVSNELLAQLLREGPGTVRELERAFREGLLHPVYLPAHHTHPALLSPEELLDELRLNAELLHGELGVPVPRLKGIFFTECSVDRRMIPAVEAAGYDYCFVPELDPHRIAFRVTPGAQGVERGIVRIGERLIGIVRHFALSQEIWRPLTRRYPEKVKYQGFLVGEEPVFSDEYRGGPLCQPTQDDDAMRQQYAEVIRRALLDAPAGACLLYLQDLELMDFGEAALAVAGAAWKQARGELAAEVRVEFTAPGEAVERALDRVAELPCVELERASWAPEIRPALRSDGHYPPRGAGPFRGLDADQAIFRRRPFVFWEAGRFASSLYGWLLECFGYPAQILASARTLAAEGYRLDRFPPVVRLPMLLRLTKRACNWGWYPEEGLSKRPFLHGLLLCEALRLQLALSEAFPPPRLFSGLRPSAFEGLRRLPEVLVDTRVGYLTFGLELWRDQRGQDPSAALLELEEARSMRHAAEEAIRGAELAYRRLLSSPDPARWDALLTRVQEHCTSVFLALDHIQRAWGRADPEFLVVAMYRYLYDLYPPLMPTLLDEVEELDRPQPERAAPAEEAQPLVP